MLMRDEAKKIVKAEPNMSLERARELVQDATFAAIRVILDELEHTRSINEMKAIAKDFGVKY
jgi:hypothetical protein